MQQRSIRKYTACIVMEKRKYVGGAHPMMWVDQIAAKNSSGVILFSSRRLMT
jgi:hypothetical protein